MNKLSKVIDDFIRPVERFLESKITKLIMLLILLFFLAMGLYFFYTGDDFPQNLKYPQP